MCFDTYPSLLALRHNSKVNCHAKLSYIRKLLAKLIILLTNNENLCVQQLSTHHITHTKSQLTSYEMK